MLIPYIPVKAWHKCVGEKKYPQMHKQAKDIYTYIVSTQWKIIGDKIAMRLVDSRDKSK